jgi:hypothetical protein
MKYECSSKGAYSFPLIIQNVVLETSTLQSLFFFLSFILFFRTEQVILEENLNAQEQGIKSIELTRKGVLTKWIWNHQKKIIKKPAILNGAIISMNNQISAMAWRKEDPKEDNLIPHDNSLHLDTSLLIVISLN